MPAISIILQFDFGNSYVYQKPVLNVIVSKFPVSLFFGLTSFFLAYLISIPLGVRKAMTHGGLSDRTSAAGCHRNPMRPAGCPLSPVP